MAGLSGKFILAVEVDRLLQVLASVTIPGFLPYESLL
jgi:hypothetical protein